MSPKKHSDQFSRREFLHLLSTLGGAAAFTAFLQACSQAGLDPTQALIPTSMPTRFSPTDTLEQTAISTQETLDPTENIKNPTESPGETKIPDSSEIAFVKTSERAKGVRQAVEILGLKNVDKKDVFLKPNFNSSDPAPGSTHPDIFNDAVLLQILE